MKAIAACLVGMVVMLLVGAACLGVGLLEREMVRAEQQVVAKDYRAPAKTFEKAERYYEQASHVPWIGTRGVNDIRAREAALEYWQQRYGTLVSGSADPMANVPTDNIELQFLVANSVYRVGVARATDRASTIAALDAGIGAYFTVLKNAERHDDASYNYEYLLRLRDDIEQGRRKTPPPPEAESPEGRVGKPPVQAETSKFKVYIPRAPDENDKNDAAAGKATTIKRKG